MKHILTISTSLKRVADSAAVSFVFDLNKDGCQGRAAQEVVKKWELKYSHLMITFTVL